MSAEPAPIVEDPIADGPPPPPAADPPDMTARLADHAAWLASDGVAGRRLEAPAENLAEVSMPVSDLRRADFTRAILARANLAGADLTGAVLRGADLSGADLTSARLTDAVLTGARLDGAALAGAEDAAAKADLFEVLDGAPHEVARLRGHLEAGTLAPGALDYLRSVEKPADRWFRKVRRGAKSDDPTVSMLLRWLDEWEAAP
jgi:hypothetical protein